MATRAARRPRRPRTLAELRQILGRGGVTGEGRAARINNAAVDRWRARNPGAVLDVRNLTRQSQYRRLAGGVNLHRGLVGRAGNKGGGGPGRGAGGVAAAAAGAVAPGRRNRGRFAVRGAEATLASTGSGSTARGSRASFGSGGAEAAARMAQLGASAEELAGSR